MYSHSDDTLQHDREYDPPARPKPSGGQRRPPRVENESGENDNDNNGNEHDNAWDDDILELMMLLALFIFCYTVRVCDTLSVIRAEQIRWHADRRTDS